MTETYQSEEQTHQGRRIRVAWYRDDSMDAPWKEHDGHGIVSDWTQRDKRSGELILSEDRGSKRFYDFAATVRKARGEGWGLAPDSLSGLAAKIGRPPTSREVTAESVRLDFENLRSWCRDEWCFVGYVVTIEGTSYEESLWGIESTAIDEETQELFAAAREWIEREDREAFAAACSDIATI